MKAALRYMLLLAAIGCLGGRAQGDGKFYADKVPADIPYQRAFILFHEGSQMLVLQSKYEFSQSAEFGSLGWIVPVPTVPEVGSAHPDEAKLFFLMTSLRVHPNVFRISSIFFTIATFLFLGSVVFLLICLAQRPFLSKIGLSKAAWYRRLKISLFMICIGFLLIVVTIPSLGVSGVEIVKAQKAGIYDVKVIKSEKADAIVDWLKENGFSFSDKDTQVFEDYIDRNWCFVVAKVEPDSKEETQKIVGYKGMVAPLVLKFETVKPVYPLALTSTIGADTEILLYTLSEKKLICDERVKLRIARSTRTTNFIGLLKYVAKPQTFGNFADIPESMFLCKFKEKLNSEEMKRDIQFEFAPDSEPYAETIVVW
jgi:hypothetical protein